MGRPKSKSAERKVVVSGYVGEATFRKIAIQAIKEKKSISQIVNTLICKGQTANDMQPRKEK